MIDGPPIPLQTPKRSLTSLLSSFLNLPVFPSSSHPNLSFSPFFPHSFFRMPSQTSFYATIKVDCNLRKNQLPFRISPQSLRTATWHFCAFLFLLSLSLSLCFFFSFLKRGEGRPEEKQESYQKKKKKKPQFLKANHMSTIWLNRHSERLSVERSLPFPGLSTVW